MNCLHGAVLRYLLCLPLLWIAFLSDRAIATPEQAAPQRSAWPSPHDDMLTVRHLAQVIPSVAETNTVVTPESGGSGFEIDGGTQAGSNLFHRFEQFDLSAGQMARFLANPTVETIFSQVSGPASSIDGLLQVSGSSADLFVINPAGILLGPNARLDLGGSFVATTADQLGFGEQWIDRLGEGLLGGAQLEAGRWKDGATEQAIASPITALGFSTASGGIIVNQGQLSVGKGQSLGLLGRVVINSGALTAPGGEVTVLAATEGQSVSLGGGLLKFASGGDVLAEPARLYLNQIDPFLVEATNLAQEADGSISLASGTAIAAGQIDVSSSTGVGGVARLLGNQVQTVGVVVDASGTQGGSIYVGGDRQGQGTLLRSSTTQVDARSVLRADGLTADRALTDDIRPDGGQITVWSDGATTFAGEASARGGVLAEATAGISSLGGNGGRVETSGKEQLTISPTAIVNTTAAQGKTGQWLLDPTDLTVIPSSGSATVADGTSSPATASTIDRATLEAGLNGNNVELQATNSISIDTPIDTTGNASPGNLLLTTPTINLNERIQLNGSLSGTATTVNVAQGASIQNGVDAVATNGVVNLTGAFYREGQTVTIERSLALRGQGLGTTITGDADGDGAGDHRIFDIASSGTDVTIGQLRLVRGTATGNGGAIRSSARNLTIEDVVLRENRAASDGGALENQNSGSMTLLRTRFINNVAAENGGALNLSSGSVTVRDSFFNGNTASGTGSTVGKGGAVDVDSGATFSAVGTDFSDNAVTGRGGAIHNEGTVVLEAVAIQNNQATAHGGGIYSSGPDSLLSVFSNGAWVGNQAGNNGGGLYLAGEGQIDGLGITQNVAGSQGGGIYNSGSLSLANVGISSNQAQQGAGIANIGAGSRVDIRSFGIQDNVAANSGGGLLNRLGTVNLQQGAVARNESIDGDGGGILSRGELSLAQVAVRENQASGFGGGLLLLEAIADIQSTRFEDNQAANDGGGLRLARSTVNIADSQFSGNRAAFGAGLEASESGAVSVENTAFSGNVADRLGGGLQNDDSVVMVLDNPTFEGNSAGIHGGAISNSAMLSVNGGIFRNNRADLDGGAVFTFEGELAISDAEFQANQAARSGGAIAGLDSNLSIANANFDSNRGGVGGALGQKRGSLRISQSDFLNNEAQQRGGAIALDGVGDGAIADALIQGNQAVENGGGIVLLGRNSLDLRRVVIQQNQADGMGGGIAAPAFLDFEGRLTITDSTVDQNQAGGVTGGVHFNPATLGSLEILNSTVSNNQAPSQGGLLIGEAATARLENITISGNQAEQNAGGLANAGATTVRHATISSNVTGADGGGTGAGGILSLPEGNLSLGNSIVAENRIAGRTGVSGEDIAGALEDQGNNLIGNGAGATGLTARSLVGTSADPIDPLLAPLGAYGGPTETMALLPGSPAIDAINAAIAGAVPVPLLDQRGITRGEAGDIGAFESSFVTIQAPPAPPQPPALLSATATLPRPPLVPESPVLAQPSVLAQPPVPADAPVISELPVLGEPLFNEASPASLEPSPGRSPLSFSSSKALTDLDTTFSAEYFDYWQGSTTPGSPMAQAADSLAGTEGAPLAQIAASLAQTGSGGTLAQTRELLNHAEVAHKVKSAVVYAFFVPQSNASDGHFGLAQTASMALTRRLSSGAVRDDDVLMLVLVPGEGEPAQQLVNVTRKEMMQQVRLFRMAVSDPEDPWSYRPLAQQMQRWLFAPIEAELEQRDLDNVMYALAPGLRTIPLAAMMEGDRFVIERYGVSLIPSVDLLETDFGSSPPPTQTLAAGANEFEELNDLPAVSVELEAIATHRQPIDLLFNQDFTRANLVSTQVRSQAKMLHLATHGAFNAGDIGQSYLQFWDDQLTLDDVSQLGWNELELLILSACQTAASSPEAELGFAGLAAATGVESTIGSLWTVSDIGTLGMMAEFYGQLGQEPLRFEALRQTQLAMLKGETAIAYQTLRTERGEIDLPPDWSLPDVADFSHPFYWSGFTLVGNPWW